MTDGRHPRGCFYGGPDGHQFWIAVRGCPQDHSAPDGRMWFTREQCAAAWEHLYLAGLLVTGESG